MRTKAFILFLLTIISLLGFEEVVDDVFYDVPEGDLEAEEFDRSLTLWVASHRSPLLNQVMTDLTGLGSISVLAVFSVAMMAILIAQKNRRGLAHFLLAATGAGAWPVVLKEYFIRERPSIVDHLVRVSDFSFPSGHSFGATAMYVTFGLFGLQYLKSTTQHLFWSFFIVTVIGLVGLSRIYLGVHFPNDVLGGVSSGAAWAFLVATLFEIKKIPQVFTSFQRRPRHQQMTPS